MLGGGRGPGTGTAGVLDPVRCQELHEVDGPHVTSCAIRSGPDRSVLERSDDECADPCIKRVPGKSESLQKKGHFERHWATEGSPSCNGHGSATLKHTVFGHSPVGEPVSARLHQTDESLLFRLRAGDQAAFASVVDALNGRLLALARTFTSSPALAEDIVQETWLGVIRGLRGFEGRSTLRTWIFSILVRRARTVTAREARRSFPKSPPEAPDGSTEEWQPGAGKIGLWSTNPVPWHLADPASILQSKEALEVIREAISQLPQKQRRALLLRDVEDIGTKEVCNILDVSETHLRVLLHRGRARIRKALDRYVRGDTSRPSQPTNSLPSVGPSNLTIEDAL